MHAMPRLTVASLCLFLALGAGAAVDSRAADRDAARIAAATDPAVVTSSRTTCRRRCASAASAVRSAGAQRRAAGCCHGCRVAAPRRRGQHPLLARSTRSIGSNVTSLQTAWTYDAGDAFTGSEMQSNPVVVGGVLYVTTPSLKVVAIDARTGVEKWRFDPSGGAAPGRAIQTSRRDRPSGSGVRVVPQLVVRARNSGRPADRVVWQGRPDRSA